MFVIAGDHAGYGLKEKLKNWFEKTNQKYYDIGPDKVIEDDSFVLYAKNAIEYYKKNCSEKDVLLLICGSGIGMSIVANRDNEIRAVLALSVKQAKQARLHNNANCLCLGARNTCLWTAKRIIRTFCQTDFLGGKYQERMNTI